MLTDRLLVLLLALTPREREVIVDYYLRGRTLDELAREYGVTKSAVGLLKVSGEKKMRAAGETLLEQGATVAV